MELNREIFNQAVNQVTFRKGMFCDNGARIFAAIEKAEIEIEFNESVQFENGILTFVSRESHKPRTVNANGCHTSCDCGGGISYHITAYWILEAYHEIYSKEDLNLQPTEKACKICSTQTATRSGRCHKCRDNSEVTYLPNSDRRGAIKVGNIRIN